VARRKSRGWRYGEPPAARFSVLLVTVCGCVSVQVLAGEKAFRATGGTSTRRRALSVSMC
jgi:hypothetical protein